jgi:hypothetical protein
MMIWKTGKPCLQTLEFSKSLEIAIWPGRPLAFCFLCMERSKLYGALISDELTFLRLATRRVNALAISVGSSLLNYLATPLLGMLCVLLLPGLDTRDAQRARYRPGDKALLTLEPHPRARIAAILGLAVGCWFTKFEAT